MSRPLRTGFGSWLVLAWTIALLSPPASGSPAAQGLAQKVQSAYDATSDIQADFVQETKIQGFQSTTRSEGKVAIKKSGKARWDFRAPSEQHVYVKDGIVVIYTPELGQALKARLESSLDSQTPIFLLAGAARLTDYFSISPDPAAREGASPSLVLIPKDGRGPKRIVVTLDPSTYLITRVRIEDPNGNISTLTFSNIRQNTGVGDRFFAFTPPKGVEVVEPFPSGSRSDGPP